MIERLVAGAAGLAVVGVAGAVQPKEPSFEEEDLAGMEMPALGGDARSGFSFDGNAHGGGLGVDVGSGALGEDIRRGLASADNTRRGLTSTAPAGIRRRTTCSAPASYYAFDLVSTRRIPGTGLARGRVEVRLPEKSPFAIALAVDGSYEYTVVVGIERVKPPPTGTLVAWVTTPDLDHVRLLGPLDEDLRAKGSVDWNKFIVVVTLEESVDPAAERWAGPVAFRGMSRSGAMHTMVGHGALQQENCAAWGY